MSINHSSKFEVNSTFAFKSRDDQLTPYNVVINYEQNDPNYKLYGGAIDGGKKISDKVYMIVFNQTKSNYDFTKFKAGSESSGARFIINSLLPKNATLRLPPHLKCYIVKQDLNTLFIYKGSSPEKSAEFNVIDPPNPLPKIIQVAQQTIYTPPPIQSPSLLSSSSSSSFASITPQVVKRTPILPPSNPHPKSVSASFLACAGKEKQKLLKGIEEQKKRRFSLIASSPSTKTGLAVSRSSSSCSSLESMNPVEPKITEKKSRVEQSVSSSSTSLTPQVEKTAEKVEKVVFSVGESLKAWIEKHQNYALNPTATNTIITARPSQIEVMQQYAEARKRLSKMIFPLPTGFGKTFIFASIAEATKNPSSDQAFLVVEPVVELIFQTTQDFKDYYPNLKVAVIYGKASIKPGHYRTLFKENDVVIITYASFMKQYESLDFPWDLVSTVCFDEGHNNSSVKCKLMLKTLLETKSNIENLSFTATPVFTTGQNTFSLFHEYGFDPKGIDNPIPMMSVKETIDKKITAAIQLGLLVLQADPEDSEGHDNTLTADVESRSFDRESYINTVVEAYMNAVTDFDHLPLRTKKAIFITAGISHAVHVAQAFNNISIDLFDYSGKMREEYAQQIMQDSKQKIDLEEARDISWGRIKNATYGPFQIAAAVYSGKKHVEDKNSILKDNTAVLKKSKLGGIAILIGCDQLIEGYNDKKVKVCVMFRVCISTKVVTQGGGRANRYWEGKPAIIIQVLSSNIKSKFTWYGSEQLRNEEGKIEFSYGLPPSPETEIPEFPKYATPGKKVPHGLHWDDTALDQTVCKIARLKVAPKKERKTTEPKIIKTHTIVLASIKKLNEAISFLRKAVNVVKDIEVIDEAEEEMENPSSINAKGEVKPPKTTRKSSKVQQGGCKTRGMSTAIKNAEQALTEIFDQVDATYKAYRGSSSGRSSRSSPSSSSSSPTIIDTQEDKLIQLMGFANRLKNIISTLENAAYLSLPDNALELSESGQETKMVQQIEKIVECMGELTNHIEIHQDALSEELNTLSSVSEQSTIEDVVEEKAEEEKTEKKVEEEIKEKKAQPKTPVMSLEDLELALRDIPNWKNKTLLEILNYYIAGFEIPYIARALFKYYPRFLLELKNPNHFLDFAGLVQLGSNFIPLILEVINHLPLEVLYSRNRENENFLQCLGFHGHSFKNQTVIIQTLINKGATLAEFKGFSKNQEMQSIYCCIINRCNWEVCDFFGNNLLDYLWIKDTSYECEKFIIEKLKAHINTKNRLGDTPLHNSLSREIEPNLINHISLLINHGADPTIQNNSFKTPTALFFTNLLRNEADRSAINKSNVYSITEQILDILINKNTNNMSIIAGEFWNNWIIHGTSGWDLIIGGHPISYSFQLIQNIHTIPVFKMIVKKSQAILYMHEMRIKGLLEKATFCVTNLDGKLGKLKSISESEKVNLYKKTSKEGLTHFREYFDSRLPIIKEMCQIINLDDHETKTNIFLLEKSLRSIRQWELELKSYINRPNSKPDQEDNNQSQIEVDTNGSSNHSSMNVPAAPDLAIGNIEIDWDAIGKTIAPEIESLTLPEPLMETSQILLRSDDPECGHSF